MSGLIDRRDPDWDAPPDHSWVCLACGKYGPKQDYIGDESCFLNAVLVLNSDMRIANGRVVEVQKVARR